MQSFCLDVSILHQSYSIPQPLCEGTSLLSLRFGCLKKSGVNAKDVQGDSEGVRGYGGQGSAVALAVAVRGEELNHRSLSTGVTLLNEAERERADFVSREGEQLDTWQSLCGVPNKLATNLVHPPRKSLQSPLSSAREVKVDGAASLRRVTICSGEEPGTPMVISSALPLARNERTSLRRAPFRGS